MRLITATPDGPAMVGPLPERHVVSIRYSKQDKLKEIAWVEQWEPQTIYLSAWPARYRTEYEYCERCACD